MNERKLRERFRALRALDMPAEARERIRATLMSAQARPTEERCSGTRRVGWWIGAGALAAGLLVAGVVGSGVWPAAPHHFETQTHSGTPSRAVVRLQALPLQLHMLSSRKGLAISGHRLLLTRDGGSTWTDITPPGFPGRRTLDRLSLSAFDQSHFWLAAGSETTSAPAVVYRTSDGGRSWHSTSLELHGAPQIDFVTAQSGFLVLYPQGGSAGSEAVQVLRSRDGGRSWTEVAGGGPNAWSPVLFPGDKTGLEFSDPMTGFITGNAAAHPVLLDVTQDGGVTWRQQDLPMPAGYRTQDDTAQSQPPRFSTPSDGVLPVWFFGQGNAFDFYQTTDGGRHWTPTAPLSVGGLALYSVADPEHIFVSDGAHLYMTSDGGRHWDPIRPNIGLSGAGQLDFVGGRDGWAVLPRGLFRTTDGGRHWTKVLTFKKAQR